MKTLSIDIETYSSCDLAKSGVYRYAESSDFEVLLFGYAVDGGEVKVIDIANGEKIPAEVIAALTDETVKKYAFNAQFERVCLSRFLGYPKGEYLSPDSWYCTMVWAATLGLPLSLEKVGAVLGLEEQKLTMQFVNEGYKVIKKNYLTLEKRSYAGKQWVSPLDHKTYDMGDRKRVIVRVGDGFKNYINDEHKDGDRLCRFMAGSKAIPSEQLAAENS